MSAMGGGILEVLVVSAEDIRHTNLFGTPAYYVIIECGSQLHSSKASSGRHAKAWWNQQFTFEHPSSDWNNLTHISFRIMERGFFANTRFVGQSIVQIGGIISEGYERGYIEIKPAPYNVVLEDDIYKGEIKIGFKFIAKKEVQEVEAKDCKAEEKKPILQPFCSNILNIWRISWWRFLCFSNQKESSNK